jgi:hypothetical protein
MDGRCGKTSKYFATEQKKSPSFFWMYRCLTWSGGKFCGRRGKVWPDIPMIISSGHAAEVELYFAHDAATGFLPNRTGRPVGRSRG